MRLNRSLLATILALPCSLIACGGDDGGNNNGGPDAGGGGQPPTGTHYGYVVSKANAVPSTTAGNTVTDLGLDLGSSTSATLDGKVDNALGQTLLALQALFDVKGTIDTAINNGSIILLADIQTTDFTNAAASGIQVKFGANPSVKPCTNDADPTTCGQHLKAGTTFDVAADSPTDAALTGKFVNGTFSSDSGNVGLAIALGDAATPVNINLVHARVKATSVTADGFTANVGGLVTQAELKANIAPAILGSVNKLLTTAGCVIDGTVTAAGCGCTAPIATTTALILTIDADKNCQLTVDELLAFAPVKSALKVDACAEATCAAADAYSIGVQVTAVKATIK